MAFNRERKVSVFSRKVLLLLLLLAPRQDPLYFSVQSGQSLIPDPGVKLSLSQPSSHGVLPGPEAILSVTSCQALADTYNDLLNCSTLTLVLMSLLKIICRRYKHYISINFSIITFIKQCCHDGFSKNDAKL